MAEKNLRFKEGDFACHQNDVIDGDFIPYRIIKSFPDLAVDYYIKNGENQTAAHDKDLLTLEQARYIITCAMVKYVKNQMAEIDKEIIELRSNPSSGIC